jgi:MFS family permease
MQQIAMSWLVYRLTDSPFLLSLVSFTGSIPMFFFASIAGTFVDRWDRHRLLLIAQICAMVQAALLTFLTLSGLIAVWHVFVLSFFLGLVNAFDMPTRHSFVIDMVEEKADLSNAIALNSAMFNGARLVGPSLAGLTVAAFGEGVCFLLNTLSFMAIIMALLAMRIQRRATVKTTTRRTFEELKEGYRYAFGFAPIRYLLLVLVVLNFMGMQYVVLMPVFARDILHGGAHTQGFLVAASGVGALASAVYLAARRSVVGLYKVSFRSLGLFGCAIMAFSFSRNVYLSLGLMVVSGMVMMAVLISCNTIIQTLVDEDKRGRVMSLHAMSTIGTFPFGSLMVGVLATYLGAAHAVLIGSGFCIAASIIFGLKLPRLRAITRPIYIARGIMPETRQ